MDKIIGKLLQLYLFLFVCIGNAVAPSIKLRLLSADGEDIEYVAVGEPFRIELLMEGFGTAPKSVDIPGLDRINARRNGYFLTTINGVSSIKFNFQAQLDKPTFVMLGPVTATHDDKEIISNRLKVIAKVSDDSTRVTRKKKEERETFLRFYVDKKEAVVGEKIVARLRFYSGGDDVHVRQLNQRELPAFTLTSLEGPTQGQETIDGHAYQYAEWRWSLFPKESGKLVIPAYSLDYDKVIQRTNQWSFLSLFGTRMENKRVHSNAQVITVKPLPDHKGPVFLIGKLTDVTAELVPDAINIGDAAILAIEAEGEGNIDGIEHIILTGMPDSLKYYDSKNVMLTGSTTGRFARKRFEFIVQGLQEGTWQIPSQTFTYFDVGQKRYAQKLTEPLTITINPGTVTPVSLDAQKEQEKDAEISSSQELGAINTKGPWNATPERTSLPWWLFWILVFMPFGLVVGAALWRVIYGWYAQRTRLTHAFKRAHQQLVIAQSARDSRRIYYIMKTVISDRKKIPMDQVSPEVMREVLKNSGMAENKLQEWDEFLVLLTQQVYAYHNHAPELFASAHQWLNELEGVL